MNAAQSDLPRRCNKRQTAGHSLLTLADPLIQRSGPQATLPDKFR